MVVDASAVCDLLLPGDRALRDRLVAALPERSDPWLAPDVLPFEVFSVARRYVDRGALTPEAAWQRVARLDVLPIQLLPTRPLLFSAWVSRSRLGAAQSIYAALAMQAERPLLTTDHGLAVGAREFGIDVREP